MTAIVDAFNIQLFCKIKRVCDKMQNFTQVCNNRIRIVTGFVRFCNVESFTSKNQGHVLDFKM